MTSSQVTTLSADTGPPSLFSFAFAAPNPSSSPVGYHYWSVATR